MEVGPGRSKRNTLEDFENKKVKFSGEIQYFSEAFF